MDIPTVNEQVKASQIGKKSPSEPEVKSAEEILKETISKRVSEISTKIPSVTQSFTTPVPEIVIDSLLNAGYNVKYSCDYSTVGKDRIIKSIITITNPIFRNRKEEEERQAKKEFGDAVGKMLRGFSVGSNAGDKQYYDLFATFMDNV